MRETYEDYNGLERTEDFYFNLTKAEIAKMELSVSGGLSETLKRLVELQDQPAIIKIFEDLVLKAYGEKTPDGKRFVKTAELTAAFEQCPAYSNIFMKLAFDAKEAAKFINGVIPNDMSEQLNKSNTPTIE
jgi:hypothetical protein